MPSPDTGIISLLETMRIAAEGIRLYDAIVLDPDEEDDDSE